MAPEEPAGHPRPLRAVGCDSGRGRQDRRRVPRLEVLIRDTPVSGYAAAGGAVPLTACATHRSRLSGAPGVVPVSPSTGGLPRLLLNAALNRADLFASADRDSDCYAARHPLLAPHFVRTMDSGYGCTIVCASRTTRPPIWRFTSAGASQRHAERHLRGERLPASYAASGSSSHARLD